MNRLKIGFKQSVAATKTDFARFGETMALAQKGGGITR
jgi:hypothetical protein